MLFERRLSAHRAHSLSVLCNAPGAKSLNSGKTEYRHQLLCCYADLGLLQWFFKNFFQYPLIMLARFTSVVLLALVLIFQYQIWLGPRNRADLAQLRERLLAVQKDNIEKVQINAQLQAEVDDLQNGLETVEEKARYELNMIKEGEILVQYLD